MTQREQIDALREELAELRKQLSAISVAIVELAAHQPVQYVPYVYPAPQPAQPWPWWNPTITYTTVRDQAFFADAARPSGTLTTPLDGSEAEAIRDRWLAAHGG